MQAQKIYSNKLTNFMIAFTKFIHPFKLTSPIEYFHAQGLRNANEISKLEFFKIVQPLQPKLNFSPSDINQVFYELDDGWGIIAIKHFMKIYDQIMSKVPQMVSKNQVSSKEQQAKKLQERKRRQEEQKQRKNKIIMTGLKKLLSFIQENDALALFAECDEDFSDQLDPKEFNKLLICTGIKEFQDKQIRKIIIDRIYSQFSSKKITKKDYIRLFKIKENFQTNPKPKFQFFVPHQKGIPLKPPQKNQIHKQNPNQTFNDNFNHPNQKNQQPRQNPNQTINEIKIPSQPNIVINIKAPQNKNQSIDPQYKQFKKKNIFEVGKLGPVSPAKEEKNDDIIQGKQIFPNAYGYYRNGQPLVEELPYLQKLQNLLKMNKPYVDKHNPHTPKGQYKQARNFFNGSNYQLFHMAQSVILRQKSRIGLAREIEPKDIIQGQLGDCYFLSSIASLISIYPEVISEKFIFSQNPVNYFVIKLFINGQWRYIPTDDHFPTSNDTTPCFAKPHGKEIWAMLLQKCWAKCFESYQRIISGNSTQAFAALTGAPTEYFSIKTKEMTKEKIQKKIKQAYESKYVVTASGSDCLDSLSEKQQEDIGLVSGHAYSFLKFIDANGNYLIKIRNPWGSRVWKGDWSFESNKWNKSLRDKFNYNKCPDDGSFYMSMQDFLKYFGSFVICKVNPINLHTSLKMSFGKHKSNYVKMKVSQSGRYLLSLYQQNERQMKIKYSNYKFSTARIIVMKIGKKWEYVDSYQENQSYCTSVEVDLEQGCEYMISGKFQWVFWDQHDGCLTAYGPSKVLFKSADRSIAPEFKREMIEGFFKKNRGKTKDYNKIGAIGSYSQTFFSLEKGIGYFFITNPHEKSFDLTYSLKGNGIKVIKPQKLPFKFQMKQGTRFLKGFFTSSSGYSYETSQSLSYY